MRIATKTTTVYPFDELSEQAKERARDDYRVNNLDYEWWDSVYDDADQIAQCLGIDMENKGKRTRVPAIWFSGFASQGDGACFEGTYRYKKGWRKALLHHVGPGASLDTLLDIGQQLQAAQARQFYKLSAVVKQRGHYYHSGCTTIDVTHDDSMYRDIGDAEEDVRQALREFMDWIYQQLEREHDWLQSDECIDEALRADREYREDGSYYGLRED